MYTLLIVILQLMFYFFSPKCLFFLFLLDFLYFYFYSLIKSFEQNAHAPLAAVNALLKTSNVKV